MTTELRWDQGWDLIRDEVSEVRANRLKSLIDEISRTRVFTKMRSEVIAIGAAGNIVIDLTGITSFTFLFAYSTELCDVAVVSGEDIDLAADGMLILDGATALTYLEFTMGATAGKVVFCIAG